MKTTLTRAEVREVDRRAIEEFGVPGIVLMENAGRGTAEILARECRAGPVVICCGKGNNGGDGFVIARHLELRGVAVEILLFCEANELSGDAATNFRIVAAAGFPITNCTDRAERPEWLTSVEAKLKRAAWIVDALLGTGATGEPRGPYAVAIAAINRAGRPVLAVDLPSGLDCDTGVPATQTVRATRTCTFVARKAGFLNPAAGEFLGEVDVVDIGAPQALLDDVLNDAVRPGP